MSEFNSHMMRSGCPNSNWYVGITSNINDRLFGDHRVPRSGHWYIFRRAYSDAQARAIEKAYHDAGCQGSEGGGDSSAVFVYAYVVTAETVEGC